MAKTQSSAVLYRLSAAEDKRKELFSSLGDLGEFGVQRNHVLVAIYIGGQYFPGTTILRSDTNIQEDIWQATSGLIVKLGPSAFTMSDNKTKDPDAPVVGDWVTFIPGEGRRIQIRGVNCRVFLDENITMKVADPECITQK